MPILTLKQILLAFHTGCFYHSGSVVSTVASQQDGLVFDSLLRQRLFSEEFAHSPCVCVGSSQVLMQIRLYIRLILLDQGTGLKMELVHWHNGCLLLLRDGLNVEKFHSVLLSVIMCEKNHLLLLLKV